MSNPADNTEYCPFHLSNRSEDKCTLCGLPICNLDTNYSLNMERICPICFNTNDVKKVLKNANLFSWLIALGLVFLIVYVLQDLTYMIFLFVIFIARPFIIRPIAYKMYFKGLTPDQVVIPLLIYYEASGAKEQYKLFIKELAKIEDIRLQEMNPSLFRHLVPALIFNYSTLPDDWEDELIPLLRMTTKEFALILTTEYKEILIRIAVHSAQVDISQFMFKLANIAENDEFLVEYLKEIASHKIRSFSDSEITIVYGKLLEELYVYEDIFLALYDKFGLEEEKAIIQELISKYEPPLVPKNAIEAVLTSEQLKQRREQQNMMTHQTNNKLQEENKYD